MFLFPTGKIYTIKSSKDTNVYVGSTIQKLNTRMNVHRCFYYKNKCLGALKNIVKDFNDWEISLYENYPCNSKTELRRREGEIIKEIGTLNKCIAGRTKKEYIKDNLSSIQEKRRNYRLRNKEKLKQYYLDNVEKYKQYRLDNVEKTKERVKIYNSNNIQKNKDRRVIYRETAKNLIKETTRKYRENNIDKIKNNLKEYNINNREKIKDYYLKNIDKLKAAAKITTKKYRENNIERIEGYRQVSLIKKENILNDNTKNILLFLKNNYILTNCENDIISSKILFNHFVNNENSIINANQFKKSTLTIDGIKYIRKTKGMFYSGLKQIIV